MNLEFTAFLPTLAVIVLASALISLTPATSFAADEEPISSLITALHDDNIPGNAKIAERRLLEIGEDSWPFVIAALESSDPQQRRFATRIAMQLSRKHRLAPTETLVARAVRSLHYVRATSGRAYDERFDAVRAFLDTVWNLAEPRLRDALADVDERVQLYSALVLLRHSEPGYTPSERAYGVVIEGLVGTHTLHIADQCAEAIYALGRERLMTHLKRGRGTDDARSIAHLIVADFDDPIRHGVPFRALVSAAIDGCADDAIKGNLRHNMDALRGYGADALPWIDDVLQSPDRQQRTKLLILAQDIVDASQVRPSPQLLRASTDALRDDDVRWNASWSTRFLQRHIDDAMPFLYSCLSSDDLQQRFDAAYVLAETKTYSAMPGVIDALVEFLDDNAYAHDAQWACHAIYQFGVDALPAVRAHRDRSTGQRRRALDLIVHDLENPPENSYWGDPESFSIHGLSWHRNDPCLRPPTEWPEFSPSRSRMDAILDGTIRIEPLVSLVRDVGRARIDWRFVRGSRNYATIEIGASGSPPEVRVRYYRWRNNVEWQSIEASPTDGPWTKVEER